jgi:hypothetical protein
VRGIIKRNMDKKLSFDGVKNILENLKKSIPRSECLYCDCFQEFITELELNSDNDVTILTDPFIAPLSQIHYDFGCDTCPPREAFSQYINETSQ